MTQTSTINHQLLIAKLHAFGFSKTALQIFLRYQPNFFQGSKIDAILNSLFIQRYVLGPILYNIYLNDLFFLLNDIDICNFTYDATSNAYDFNLESVLDRENFDREKIKWNQTLINANWYNASFFPNGETNSYIVTRGSNGNSFLVNNY